MAAGNVGTAITLLEGFLASDFGSTYIQSQGMALLPDLVRQVASRADISSSLNLHVMEPTLFVSTDLNVNATACQLVALVGASIGTTQIQSAVLAYDANTVVEGTTIYYAMLHLPDGDTSPSFGATVFLDPIGFATGLRLSVTDNVTAGNIEGTGLGTASVTKVMAVYLL